jgi:hypothetical protein
MNKIDFFPHMKIYMEVTKFSVLVLAMMVRFWLLGQMMGLLMFGGLVSLGPVPYDA